MIFSSVFEFLNQNKPLNGEFLSIDLGSKKTGIAFSIQGRTVAVPWLVLRDEPHNMLSKIKELMQEKDCNYLVLGFPFAWEEEPSAKRITKFANLLSQNGITVLLYDENNTSIAVRSTAYETKGKMTKNEKQNYDSKVSALILQNAIDEILSYI